MKKKIRIKSLPKAQFAGEPPIVLTPEQQDIFKTNQNMFGFYGDVTEGSTNTTPALPTGDALVMDKSSNKEITSQKPLDDLSNLTQIAGMVPLIQTGIFANMGKKREQNKAEDQFKNRFLSDSLYASIPEGYSGNRGDYTLNYGTGLNFRPDEAVYGQFGKIAQYGGQMKRKIKITGLPKEAYGGTQNTQAVDEMYPYNSNVRRSNYSNMLGGEDENSVRQYAEEVPREIANIEAEAGETIVKPSDNGILNMYKIGGKRHSEGGTPLQAGGGDFIFSDTKDMKIKDPAILESFGMSYKKGGYTPAKISKKFNLNNPDIQKTLNDPTADIIARSTAKRMYDNNLSQLGKLALVQEARKGFPQGPPSISMPYMQKVGMDPSMFMPDVMTPQDAQVSMGKAQKGRGFWSDDYYKAALEQESQSQKEEERLQGLRNRINFSGQNRKGDFMDYVDYAFDFLPSVANYMTTGNFEPYTESFNRYIEQGNLKNNALNKVLPQVGDFITSGLAPSKSLVNEGRVALRPAYKKATEYLGSRLPKLSALSNQTKLYKELVSKYGKNVADAIDKSLTYGKSGLPLLPAAGYIALQNLSPEEKQFIEQNPDELIDYEKIEPVNIKVAPKDTSLNDDVRLNRAKTIFTEPINSSVNDKSIILDTSELEFYQDGGQIKVAKNPQTNKFGVYKVVDGKATLLFNTFIGEGKTPTGSNESFAGGPEKLKQYITDLQKSGVNISNIKSAQDFQSLLYDFALDKNPETIENMWSSYGTTKKLSENPNIISELNKLGVKTNKSNAGYTLNFSNMDLSKKKDAFKILKNIYTDDKIGARTLTLDLNKPAPTTVVEEPVAQTIPVTEIKQDKIGSYTQDPLVAANVARRPSAGVYPQDVMNLGLALGNRLGINKYMPYDVAMPQPMLMDPTFYDPSRELAANAEMANLVTQNLGQFAGPQALSSRASQIQGSGLKGAADILGRYNNLNVGVANQFEQSNKALINDFNMKNALAKSNYYDKTVIANQQYDNAKRTANAEINQQATNAITNNAMTQVLNTLYPEFAINPAIGGGLSFVPNQRSLSGSSQQSQPSIESLRKFYAENFPNLSKEDIDKELIKRFNGSGSSNKSDSRNDFLRDFMNLRNRR